MKALAGIVGVFLIFFILWDAFEAIILPRRVTRKFRLAVLFYRTSWHTWRAIARQQPNLKRREAFLSFFGPLSLIFLLTTWAVGLVLSFALLHWAGGSRLVTQDGISGFNKDVYFSGTTFFTLGIGDVTARDTVGRVLTVVESGVGFGFLAIVIGYLPVLYQAFSRREVNVSLLDARAGSPPSAAELLRRHSHDHGKEALQQLLYDWERWSAELLESHISYPVLAYYRSQHSNQSWLAALTAILDTSALVMAGVESACSRQAELTFAMARHAVVDLAQIFRSPPGKAMDDRLNSQDLLLLRHHLAQVGWQVREDPSFEQKLAALRAMYEPYIQALSRFLAVALPPWVPEAHRADSWQTSAWEKAGPLPKHLHRIETPVTAGDEH